MSILRVFACFSPRGVGRGWFALALLGLCGAVSALASPAERDLGHGLLYFRLKEIPADLPAKALENAPACIVDVRYVKADAEAARAFFAWLRQRGGSRPAIFVLANAATSSALTKPLTAQPRGSGIVVVGIAERSFAPQVEVASTPEAERAAYDAFEKGAAPGALLAEHPDKLRNDEASLSRDRLADASAEATDGASAVAAPRAIDAALQRAVHLHRSLVALRKL